MADSSHTLYNDGIDEVSLFLIKRGTCVIWKNKLRYTKK